MRWAIAFWCTLSIATFARGETHEVRTPHFTVVTDAGLDVGKAVAARLESIRVLLEEAFPTENRRYRDHVVVHAVSDEQAMARLLPAMWEDENVRKPDGLFWEGPDKDYIVGFDSMLPVRGPTPPYTTSTFTSSRAPASDGFRCGSTKVSPSFGK